MKQTIEFALPVPEADTLQVTAHILRVDCLVATLTPSCQLDKI